uniref:Uncharacterized protein n=1 Tax=Minutocellus polymorphus TaxID=265543 RepID=A0A7S0FND6_9STRA
MAQPQQQMNTDSDETEGIVGPSPDNQEDFTILTGFKKAESKSEKKSQLAPAQNAAVEELNTIEDQAEVQEEMEQDEETDQAALQSAYVSEVAVRDGKELIPVEYFLVRRLRAIISQAKTSESVESNSKKTGEKIVFL